MSRHIKAAAQGMLNLTCMKHQVQAPLMIQAPEIVVTQMTHPDSSSKGNPKVETVHNVNGKRRNSDNDDARYGKTLKRVSAQPMDSRAHFNLRYTELKRLSEGDNGETFAAIEKAVLTGLIRKHEGKTNTPAFFDDVRGNLVAVKYVKPNNLEGDLTGEITFLKEKFPFDHRLLNFRKDSHLEGDCQWLALPYASGGALLNLCNDFPTDLSLSFRWHIAGQLIEALLFLFFGVQDAADAPDAVPEWLNVVHGDIFTGNTLLDAPRPDDPTGFPTCIVADFGRADCQAGIFGDTIDSWGLRNVRMRKMQTADITQVGRVLQSLTLLYLEAVNPCEHHDVGAMDTCSRQEVIDSKGGEWECCRNIVVGLDNPSGPEADFVEMSERLMAFGSCREDFADAYELMRGVVRTAQVQKMKHFRPLSDALRAHLATPYVSDQDLKTALAVFGANSVSSRPIKPLPMRLKKQVLHNQE